MEMNNIAFWMTLISLVCWPICFWWMHLISFEQSQLLDQLREQGKRIEKLSRIEHDLIQEVHPQVGEIKDGLQVIIAAVTENADHPELRANRGDEVVLPLSS